MKVRSALIVAVVFLSVDRVSAQAPSQLSTSNRDTEISGPVLRPWASVGPVLTLTNTGETPGYGTRLNYFSKAKTPGSDLAAADISFARADAPDRTNYMAHWFVQVSPLDNSHRWTSTVSEMNPVNRGDDPGWTDNLGSLERLTGGIRVVPEATAFGENGTGHNVEFGYAIAPSGGQNELGKRTTTYNGLIIEANSIGPNGRGVLASGSTESKSIPGIPSSPFEARRNWYEGLTTVSAFFASSNAVHIGTGQSIALTDDGNVKLQTNSAGNAVEIVSNGKRLFSLNLSTGDLQISGKLLSGDGTENLNKK